MIMETLVAVLLAVTIGYCVVLNWRLKRLHADRDELRHMVADLVGATNLADAAIKELKATAIEADLTLTARLEEAERFGIQLANHVQAGHSVMERITKIMSAVKNSKLAEFGEPEAAKTEAEAPKVDGPTRVRNALAQLVARDRIKGAAA
jgi:class 3 adenylate cyclase